MFMLVFLFRLFMSLIQRQNNIYGGENKAPTMTKTPTDSTKTKTKTPRPVFFVAVFLFFVLVLSSFLLHASPCFANMRFDLDGLDVLFPYDKMYPEQYDYMARLKESLDASGPPPPPICNRVPPTYNTNHQLTARLWVHCTRHW